jgi:hypothetical protein
MIRLDYYQGRFQIACQFPKMDVFIGRQVMENMKKKDEIDFFFEFFVQ